MQAQVPAPTAAASQRPGTADPTARLRIVGIAVVASDSEDVSALLGRVRSA